MPSKTTSITRETTHRNILERTSALGAEAVDDGVSFRVWAPRATYRLQLRGDFGLDGVRSLLDYLQALGVSDVYLSPLFRAQTVDLIARVLVGDTPTDTHSRRGRG